MSEDMAVVAVAAIAGGVFLLVNHLNRQCPKCRRFGARMRGERKLVNSTEESRSEWQNQEVGSRYKEYESEGGIFGAKFSRTREAYYEDVEYKVTTKIDYYEIPCSCKYGKCGHQWTENPPPVEHISRRRV